jgi:hypothetical protein
MTRGRGRATSLGDSCDGDKERKRDEEVSPSAPRGTKKTKIKRYLPSHVRAMPAAVKNAGKFRIFFCKPNKSF